MVHFCIFLAILATFLSKLVFADPRYVFAHFMVGNSYPYTQAMWTNDILAAQSLGIDGFALNLGSDSWQPDRIADAYAAAAAIAANNSSVEPFKLFLSFDMTCLSDAGQIVNYIQTYHGHGNQFVYQGKDFVSTFSGETVTFGADNCNDGWQSAVKDVLAGGGIEIYFVPQWSALAPQTVFQSNPVVDGIFCWTAWPNGDTHMTTDTDVIYMTNANATGKTYMAAWSPWFFTHFSYKNWIYKSETLFAERWNELIDLAPPMVELISWNDYGESHYFWQTDGALPAGSEEWVDGFDHSPWASLLPFFIAAYKSNQTFPTGNSTIVPGSLSFPTAPTNIVNDTVVFWYRPHSKDAVASTDSLPVPTSNTDADDIVHCIAILSEPGTIVINSGSSSQSFSAVAGFNEFSLDFVPGTQSVELVRNGQTVACGTGANPIVSAPQTYNYNAVVTQVVPGGCSA